MLKNETWCNSLTERLIPNIVWNNKILWLGSSTVRSVRSRKRRRWVVREESRLELQASICPGVPEISEKCTSAYIESLYIRKSCTLLSCICATDSPANWKLYIMSNNAILLVHEMTDLHYRSWLHPGPPFQLEELHLFLFDQDFMPLF